MTNLDLSPAKQEMPGAVSAASGASEASEASEGYSLPACCAQTLRLHARHNPMMMCPDCKQVIKCFPDERSFNAYLLFCKTKHRKVSTTTADGMYIVTFKEYDVAR